MKPDSTNQRLALNKLHSAVASPDAASAWEGEASHSFLKKLSSLGDEEAEEAAARRLFAQTAVAGQTRKTSASTKRSNSGSPPAASSERRLHGCVAFGLASGGAAGVLASASGGVGFGGGGLRRVPCVSDEEEGCGEREATSAAAAENEASIALSLKGLRAARSPQDTRGDCCREEAR